jgi:hypothetical protein
MVRRYVNQLAEFKTIGFGGLDCLFRPHAQFGSRSARLAQDGCFLSRPRMPVDDGEPS